jgi:FlaA1/EpsC-like NDP-sugar epimerase
LEDIKNIMIIGAGGSLGSCLCKLLIGGNYNVTAVDISENNLAYLNRVCGVSEKQIYMQDMCDFNKLKNIIEYQQVDIVINCAALKHVMWCEYNIKYAINMNVMINLELISYLSKNDKEFIFISTDKAINPVNIYALTKQLTDYITKMYGFKLVRGVNFLNSNGSVLDIWDRQFEEKKPFTVINNKKCSRYFIKIEQMASLVQNAIEDSSGRVEHTPLEVYSMSIHKLFKAYLSLNNIKDYEVDEISLGENEKEVEDLNFDSKVIELGEEEEIIQLLRDISVPKRFKK